MDAASLEKFYTMVYDVVCSPCGRFLVACDNFGRLATFSLARALGPNATQTSWKPLKIWKGAANSIYCLFGSHQGLFSGGHITVKSWRWKDVTTTEESKVPQPQYELVIPPKMQNDVYDVNAIVLDEECDCIYVAYGNDVLSWCLSTQQLKATYSSHSKYIHSLTLRPPEKQFITGSEDGTVKVWNPSQSNSPTNSLQPGKNGKGRSNGHWVGYVAVDETGEWMVCGGGFAPCLYHLNSLSKITSLDVPKKMSTHTAIFTTDRVITGGAEPTVRHWAVNGNPIASVPSTLTHVFTLAHNSTAPQYEVLAVAGDSADINIFTNFGYKAFSLSFTPP